MKNGNTENSKVLIICRLDGFANSVRPKKIKELLEKGGFEVDILDTITFNIFNKDFKERKISHLKKRFMDFLKKHFLSLLVDTYLKRNSQKIFEFLKNKNYKIIICETAMDSYIFMRNLNAVKILDLPAPFIEELYYGNLISKKKYEELIKRERELFQEVDFLSFHWHTYVDYVKNNLYNDKNLQVLNWGCDPRPKGKLAKFCDKPKVIFLGYLEGYWVNLPLLSELSKIYPIDVYGGPKPNKKWGLNYKGYAPTLDVLSNYQFGLVTITKDKLRRDSFSSKHLEYLSYGLPVLTPEWRKDSILDDVSIYYNETTFLEKIQKFSKKDVWELMSKRSYKRSRDLKWRSNFKPLIKFLRSHIK
jgi:hypothetical protein